MISSLWKSKLNIPRRAYWFVFRRIVQRFGLFNIPVELQNDRMHQIGLSRTHGLDKLNKVLEDLMGKKYDERDGMFSEHLVLLASISLANTQIKRILEIGTFDGRTALILSRLFPQAEIVSIDLPDNGSDFEQLYNRKGVVEEFTSVRDNHIRQARNVDFRQVNSLALSEWREDFDLIWIDGAHGYPVVAMDVINSFRLAKKNAYLLIDDVWDAVTMSDKNYKSIGGFESLKALKESKLISEFFLFPKRLAGVFNYPGVKKHVGLFVKK